MKIFSRNFWYVLFAIIVFASLMAFFTAHPLYIYDTDDWYYISFSRHALYDSFFFYTILIFLHLILPTLI